VQTIVFLRYLKHLKSQEKSVSKKSKPQLPHLVIVPSSVLSNWEREFQTFAPDLNVVKFYGSVEERERMQWEIEQSLNSNNNDDNDDGDSDRLDVILAPVTYFQKEKATERKFLSRFKYDYLVVDEAHVLKNAQGNRYKTLNRIRSSHRLLLTGTPVQVRVSCVGNLCSTAVQKCAKSARLSHSFLASIHFAELAPGALDAPVLPDADPVCQGDARLRRRRGWRRRCRRRRDAPTLCLC
jgi:superfamily II DNA or RNA helicase